MICGKIFTERALADGLRKWHGPVVGTTQQVRGTQLRYDSGVIIEGEWEIGRFF